ncbi:MAG: 1-(5-phosphoribosyl)-5-[(5-phosphoribosylamino) methylideneamino] imidazole-4-carboxamide isomerase [Chitinophagales bacterium]|nr:MAG: 1-(5-phosphoribosyl)-5-[(5-phosphoribosylamino) methylideneamino] imidazole-4-carboxamide isomerase [Chitinophagales bacterium]
MRIIPAIDIINGRCVRLTQGSFTEKKSYHEHPLDVARKFEDAGIRYLHLVDLDGAQAGHIVHYKILEKIASATNLHIDFGGGIRSAEDLRIAFECGAQQVTAGSVAVNNRNALLNWLKEYGSEKIILGADVRQDKIAIQGWQQQTLTEVTEFIRDYFREGIRWVICTDIEKDGMLQGPSYALYEKIQKEVSEIKLIASGGISSTADLERLQALNLEGAIIGKALYEGRIKLRELTAFTQVQ